MLLLSLFAVGAAADRCPAVCAQLADSITGNVTCDVAAYDFSWGNKICEGILPLCVVRPRDAKDVSAAIKAARSSGTPLSYRSGGHSYTCNSIKTDSIHVDLRSLRSVKVQPSRHFNGTEISFGTGVSRAASIPRPLSRSALVVPVLCLPAADP